MYIFVKFLLKPIYSFKFSIFLPSLPYAGSLSPEDVGVPTPPQCGSSIRSGIYEHNANNQRFTLYLSHLRQ